MKLKVWSAILLSVVLLFYCIDQVESQVVVEQSKDKVTISGKPYYIHNVKKGETVYSISKAYGISEIELTRENPSALYGVNENQSLKIPVAESIATIVARDETKYIYHKLGPGDTIYSLSKKYDVSEDQIIAGNPQINIYNLSVGTEIAIPKKQLMVNQQSFENQDTSFSFHKVEKGESLSSISRKYGVSVKELRKENRGIIFPKVNEWLRIPRTNLPEEVISATTKADTMKVVVTEESEIISGKPVPFTSINKLTGSVNVALLLPFYLDYNSKRTEIDYGRSIDFIEMYEGILLAVDTLKSLGLSINLYPFDIQSDSLLLKQLLSTEKLKEMDLIIGPVYSNNLAIMASYAKNYGIPVVSPVPLKNNSVLVNNSNIFMVNPSLEAAQETLAAKISDYYNYNLVFIHADSAKTDPDVNYFKDAILRELRYKVPYEEIRFREFMFYRRSAFDNDSINRLGHALSTERKNLVIIASEDASVMSETITNIDALSKQFDISILGYPAMRDLKNTDPKYFFDNEIMLYTPFWIDLRKENVKQFVKDFRLRFYTEPAETSFGWQAYDLAYFFISGIAIHGKDFQDQVSMHNPELLQVRYNFMRKSFNEGYENRNLYLIKYTKEMDISVIDEKNAGQEIQK
jgi:LysM repeat protein/ABC-type branched-subunit amino acid transport system substrate-binding protein